MKLLYSVLTLALLSTVHADRMVRVLFNNGVMDPTSGSCSAADDSLIDAVLTKSSNNSTYTTRKLRSSSIDDASEVANSHRALWPLYCKKNCAGFTAGTCRATNCVGYRRRQLSAHPSRELAAVSFTCTQQVNYLNQEFTKLVTGNQVSGTCKTLLSKPRNITCYDDVIYGVVEYFKLWNISSTPQTVINSNYLGQDICKSTKLNFEAIANDCVDFMLSSVRGPNNYLAETGEYERPFSVYSDTYAQNGLFYGHKLPYLGQYELTALPDGLIEKKKVIKFNVITGAVLAVKLWDTANKVVLNANFTGGNVCNNKFITFEAVLSNCADTVKLSLVSSTAGYTWHKSETATPFTLFSDFNGVYEGRKLTTNGAYTLTIMPDQETSDKVKTINFNVVSCP